MFLLILIRNYVFFFRAGYMSPPDLNESLQLTPTHSLCTASLLKFYVQHTNIFYVNNTALDLSKLIFKILLFSEDYFIEEN